MRVGINGMGRMGRLALRAAMGGVHRAGDDPRARQPAGRRARERDQGRRGGDGAPAGIRQHPRPLAQLVRGRRRARHRGRRQVPRLQRRRLAGRRRLGRSRLRHRPGMHRQVPEARAAQQLLPARRQARDRRGAGQGRPRAERRGRRQRPALRARAPSPADGGILHDQLPGAGGQGRPRGDRHPARPDHHHPRSDQHQRRRRFAAQGSAPRALGHAVPAADHDGQRHGDRADLSGAQGQAERPRRARAGAQRQPHRLRVRAEAADDRGRGERAVRGGGEGAAGRHPGLRDPAAGVGRLLQRHAEARSSMRRAPW